MESKATSGQSDKKQPPIMEQHYRVIRKTRDISM